MRTLLPLMFALLAACGPTTPDDGPYDGPCNGSLALCDVPFDQVTLPSTHNSMSNEQEGWSIPNQQFGLTRQLDDGIRGMMLDTHYGDDGEVLLCHEYCGMGSLPLTEGLQRITDFLVAHPGEVLAIIFQDGISPEDTAAAFAETGLDALLYTHAGGDWPTLLEMIHAGTRLVVGAESQGPPPAWYHHAWDLWFDTPYSFDSIAAFSCELNRGDLDCPLFLVNHWVSDPLSTEANAIEANAHAVLMDRALTCRDEQARPINLLAVDHYAVGDLFTVVEALNELE